MKKIKQNKGVTLVALMVTIIVILILTTAVATNTNTGNDYKAYKLMCADINLLEDKVLIYYNKYREIPTKEVINNLPAEIANTNIFKKIDLEKLGNLTLNFGQEKEPDDIYIIDTTTFEVYYLQGIEYNEAIHYGN